MTNGGQRIRRWLLGRWPQLRANETPFRHWLPDRALPRVTAQALATLPIQSLPIDDTLGRRETHNSARWFFSPGHREAWAVGNAVATAFQNPDVVVMLERLTGAQLNGTSLRIEYCQDRSGFWLEPHTDIGAKRLTALVYLTERVQGRPALQCLGTDIYDSTGSHLGQVPGGFNRGLIFVPGTDTWHGFRRRTFDGVRRSLIINYVGPEWRARHELAFPDAPVGTA